MNCPLCGEELDQTGRCPNCGEESARMDTESLEPSQTLPGIFYENLAASRAEEAQERQMSRQPRYTPGERRGLFLSLVLLAAVLTTVWLGSRQYDPDAVAMYGGEGISMDNRTFAIYYCSAVAETNNQYSQQKTQPPFDPAGNLERQYINLDEDYSCADYFRQQALEDAALTESLVARANRAGFQPDAEKISAFEATLEQLTKLLQESGLPLYGAALGLDTKDLRQTDLKSCAVAVGSEGQGLRREVLDLCRGTVKIPMQPRCESLNAAVAAAVLLWEMYR